MMIWRWRHDRSPLPESGSKILPDLPHAKVAEAHEAQQEFPIFSRSRPNLRASFRAAVLDW
jgi:hypothetical protein